MRLLIAVAFSIVLAGCGGKSATAPKPLGPNVVLASNNLLGTFPDSLEGRVTNIGDQLARQIRVQGFYGNPGDQIVWAQPRELAPGDTAIFRFYYTSGLGGPYDIRILYVP